MQEIKVWNMQSHYLWGDKISWHDWDKRKIVGWRYGVDVGDFLRSTMESGKTASFLIVEVKYCGDPSDMFFATVSDIGYVDNKSKEPTDKEMEYKRNREKTLASKIFIFFLGLFKHDNKSQRKIHPQS